jgi:predicted regulator of Ras-like GTPase activity (Roadblock/LC7/MglB family)
MSFAGILKEVVEKVDGAASAMIISADGMVVEEYAALKLLNLEDLGAESSAMIRDINLAAQNLGLGNADEFSIISDRCGIVMRRITHEYYLALVIHPEGNYGKGRYVLKTTVPRISGEF